MSSEAECETPRALIPHVFELHRQIRMRQVTEVIGKLIDGKKSDIRPGATIVVLLPHDASERAMVKGKLRHYGRFVGMAEQAAAS